MCVLEWEVYSERETGGVRKPARFINVLCVTGSLTSCQIIESAGGVSALTGCFVYTVYKVQVYMRVSMCQPCEVH